jgi:hypothetical protein
MKMMSMLRAFTVVITILFLTACQQAVKPVYDSDIAGTYYLVKVDGIAIPGAISHDGVALEVSSGTFIISTDGTCTSKTRFTAPGGKEVTRKVHAKYKMRDSKLIMTWKGAGVTEGKVAGDVFIMDNHGMIFEYSRNPGSEK